MIIISEILLSGVWASFLCITPSWQVTFLDDSGFYPLCAIILLDKTCWEKSHNQQDQYHYKRTVIASPVHGRPGNVSVFPNHPVLLNFTQLFQVSAPCVQQVSLCPAVKTKQALREAPTPSTFFPPPNLQAFLSSSPVTRAEGFLSWISTCPLWLLSSLSFPRTRILHYQLFSTLFLTHLLPGPPSLFALAGLNFFDFLASIKFFSVSLGIFNISLCLQCPFSSTSPG